MTRPLPLALVLAACAMAAGIGWRIVSTWNADRLAWHAPADALRWNAHDSDALLALAREQLRRNQPQQAAATARALLRNNPLQAEALVILARVADIRHDPDAKSLFSLALQRAPRDQYARAWVIGTQLHDGAYAAALANVDALVGVAYPRLRILQPDMVRLADRPAFAKALVRALHRHPPWRAEFLAYLLAHGSPGAADSVHVGLQRLGDLDVAEAGAWFDQLTRNGRWGAAYSYWANGLQLPDRTPLSLIHNGGFESAPTGIGFGWRMPGAPGVMIERAHVPGMHGAHAARVDFSGRRSPDPHFAQTLLLGPGHYRLRFRARARDLRSEQGLAWVLSCRDGGAVLAESQRLRGSFDWKDMTFNAVVPAQGCPVQELALLDPNAAGAGTIVDGTVWFDDFAIAGATPSRPGSEVVTEKGGGRLSAGGGPFTVTMSDQPIHAGDRLLVSPGHAAIIVYADGCQKIHDQAGVYTVASRCVPTASASGPGRTAQPAAATVVRVNGADLAARLQRQQCACTIRAVGR